MLIIKPYGRSRTDFESDGKLRRKICPNRHLGMPDDASVEVSEFTKTHPELVIAQWISVIDKIAAKPEGAIKPTREQRAFRRRLGEAALGLLLRKGLLDLSAKEGKGERSIEDLWWSKIHPYDKAGRSEGKGREAVRGRWYKRFAGEADPRDANVAAIAEKIREHLHEREYRMDPGRPDKRCGQTIARAESIVQSVLVPLSQHLDGTLPWSPQDMKAYEEAGDVAARISALEKDRGRGIRGRFSVRDAAPVLYEQYGRLFRDGNGTALHVSEARKKHRGLFALHCAVKNTYARILKNHRLLKKGQRKSVAQVLPADMKTLFRLVEAKSDNRDLNALVRWGKVIHYQATPVSGQDTLGNVVDNWWPDVVRSRYRTTEGQSEIKRTEAFVRVWRNTIALAARTLKDWADRNEKINSDILLERQVERVTGKEFDTHAYRAKLPLLFGNRSHLFESEDEAFRRSVLRLALNGWADLRHSSFHFKGRGDFVKALKRESATPEKDAATAATRTLLKHDVDKRRDRLIAVLRAAHVEHYLDQERLDALIKAVTTAELPQSPLPRFRRVLDRMKNAWSAEPDFLHLPPPSNRAELEKPGLQCRYVVTKTLYEKAFCVWLEKQTAETLNGWIRCAVKRTTTAAQSINKDESAVAKAAGLIYLSDGKGIADFVDQLSARTATELRVQRGYDSDADQARKQSKYLDDLRCDVVGQAFESYLKSAGLTWVLDDLDDDPPEKKRSDADKAPFVEPSPSLKDPKDWEAVLYFLVHLVPVDAVGRLQHQLRKWSILERKSSVSGDSTQGHGKTPESDGADSVGRILGLYLDMHDAKFDDSEGMDGAEALKDLFETEDAFSRVCPRQTDKENARYVPWRGLRELLRFGCVTPLRPIFEKHPITTDQVNKLDAQEKAGEDGLSPIARQQNERERLHEKWSRDKPDFAPEDRNVYRNALAAVVEHRRLTAHVRLDNHARLHNLLMGSLGRLVDYAGLWERDLYFTTLALMALRRRKPEDVFQKDGLDLLRKGRIVKALRNLKQEAGNGKAMVDQLERLFGKNFLKHGSDTVAIRNDLTHFNMLQGRDRALDLTEVVNKTRRLMAYDRKLKNAVSQSIIELLAREGLDLTWDMKDHQLTNPKVKARQAVHLEDKKIKENLHGQQFVEMAADLFGGQAQRSNDDILSIDVDQPGNKAGIRKEDEKSSRIGRGNRGGKWHF